MKRKKLTPQQRARKAWADAMVSALRPSITRGDESFERLARILEGQISALGTTHALVRELKVHIDALKGSIDAMNAQRKLIRYQQQYPSHHLPMDDGSG